MTLPMRLGGAGAADLARARAEERRRRRLVTGVLLGVVLALFSVSMVVGDVGLSVAEVTRSLTARGTPGDDFVVHELRLPRALTGVLVGAAFGLSGGIFQALLRNPLASPDIIGITWGASAGAIVAIVVFGSVGSVVSLSALVGALAAAATIYLVAWRDGVSGARLVLIGIAIAAVLQAMVTYLLTRAEIFTAQDALTWITGSLNDMTRGSMSTLAWELAPVVVALLVARRWLGPLQLGDEFARSLGLPVERARLALILLAVALAAVATAAAGPIAFVAFVSAPISRRLVGGGSVSLVAAALVGMSVVLAADLVAVHAMSPSFPVGVVTGLVGGPYLLYVLASSNRVRRNA